VWASEHLRPCARREDASGVPQPFRALFLQARTISSPYQQSASTYVSVSRPVRIFPVPIDFCRIAILFCFQCGSESDKLNIQDIEGFELSVEHGSAFEAKPSVQHGGVDPAEVGVELRGAVVQVGEAGAWAYETTF